MNNLAHHVDPLTNVDMTWSLQHLDHLYYFHRLNLPVTFVEIFGEPHKLNQQITPTCKPMQLGWKMHK